MVGRPGLDVHPATLRPASGPARDLSHELEGPLRGAKVGQMQPGVRIHDADHGHVREVQPLRDHLGPEQDVDLAPCHALEHAVVGPLRARRVQIHPDDPRLGKAQGQEMLELLGPEPPHALRLLAAHAARCGNRLLMAAVMAPQGGWGLVHGEGDRATGAVTHGAAGRALQERGEATAIQQQNHLLLSREGATHGLVEHLGPRDPARLGDALGDAQIHDFDRR